MTDTEWTNAVGKVVLTDLIDRVVWNFQFVKKKKKTQYLQSAVKGNAIKWGVPEVSF